MASKSRIGRPPGRRRTKLVSVYLTAEELERFAAAAGDVPVSIWLRTIGRKEAGLAPAKGTAG